MFKTPVLLITFNRPDHVRKVLTEIRNQQPTQLYVCQDGARERNENDRVKCQEVRDVVKELVDWPCELHTLYQDNNLGCGTGPAAGISWFFEHVEMGLIFEDDAVPHPDFFVYASTLLEKYKDDESVRAIGSMKLFDEQFGGGSYYFSMMNRTLCAWATWRRAWKYFDLAMEKCSREDLNKAMKQYGATLREREYWMDRLDEIHKDCLGGSSWDQQFWMTIWLTGGKGICPNSNLSTNIGFDETATHTFNPNSVGSCRVLEPILPLREPTDISIQRKADLLFHKVYFEPWQYGLNGLRRLPSRILKRLRRKYTNHTMEFIRFGIVGALATGIHYGLYYLLNIVMNVNVAYTIGYVIALLCNFYLTAHFTFKSETSVKRGVGFAASHGINYVLHMLLLNLFLWVGLSETWAPVPVFCIAIPVNFILVRYVFNSKYFEK